MISSPNIHFEKRGKEDFIMAYRCCFVSMDWYSKYVIDYGASSVWRV
jgi:hypothetical protein